MPQLWCGVYTDHRPEHPCRAGKMQGWGEGEVQRLGGATDKNRDRREREIRLGRVLSQREASR
jgi:hypothetical protein